MATSILDTVKSFISPDLIARLSGSLGENETGITQALQSVVPSLLGSLAMRATSGQEGASEVFQQAKNIEGSGLLQQLSAGKLDNGILDDGLGWIKSLLGNKFETIVQSIAGFAGIKSTSVSSLFSVSGPLSLGAIGHYANQNGLSASGLSSVLSQQKDQFLQNIPGIGNLLGFQPATESSTTTTSALSEPPASTQSGGMKFLLPLLFILLLIAGIWYFAGKGGNKSEKAAQANDTMSTTAVTIPDTSVAINEAKGYYDSLSNEFIIDEGDTVSLTLPNNAGELLVKNRSTEAQLFAFLNDPQSVIDTVKGNWFDFTNIRFQSGTTRLKKGYAIQLSNLVKIVKAFPAARFKIGGYTDNTGDAAKNRLLSQQRAEAIVRELQAIGANSSQIVGAEGYGDLHPVADNNTAEGRARNRRVAVNVKAK